MFQAEAALLRRTPNRPQPILHASSCGLEVIHATRIPTHGGSIRVYGTRKGRHPVQGSLIKILDEEKRGITADGFAKFKRAVVQSKLAGRGFLSLLGHERTAYWRVMTFREPATAF